MCMSHNFSLLREKLMLRPSVKMDAKHLNVIDQTTRLQDGNAHLKCWHSFLSTKYAAGTVAILEYAQIATMCTPLYTSHFMNDVASLANLTCYITSHAFDKSPVDLMKRETPKLMLLMRAKPCVATISILLDMQP